jgi:hypothetical protein
MKLHAPAIIASVLAFALSAAAYAAAPLVGTFALQGGSQATHGYLAATPAARPGTWSFDFWMTPRRSSSPIKAYDLDMTKFMHVVVIGDDFRTFIHDHPAFLPNGHFSMEEPLAPGGYHVYADARPAGGDQQVYRFDFQAGKAGAAVARDLSERRATASVDGYSVSVSTLSLRAGSETNVAIHVTKDGKPATDLHPYLRAPAHAIFIDADDLSYVHVHPVMPAAMAGMGGQDVMIYESSDAVVKPDMLLRAALMEKGTYKLWFQFRGGSTLHVATFVFSAT